MLSLILAGAFFLLCGFASMKDMASLTIPNWVNGLIAVLFIPAALVAMPGWSVFGAHLAVGAAAFIVCFCLFLVGGFGGGDAKMIPGVLLWVGPAGVFDFLMGTALAGGVLSVAVIMARKTIPEAFAPGFVRATMQEGNGVPYGVAIAVGAIVAGFSSPFLTNFLSQFSGLH